MSTGLLFKFANQGSPSSKATPIRFNFRHTTRHLRLKLSDWMIKRNRLEHPPRLQLQVLPPFWKGCGQSSRTRTSEHDCSCLQFRLPRNSAFVCHRVQSLTT